VENFELGFDEFLLPQQDHATVGWIPDKRGGPASITCSTACYILLMDREITQRQLRNDSGEIMRGLDEGQTYVVTRNGVPVGELTPLRRHRFVRAEAAIAMFKGAPGIEVDRLRADLDSVASQVPEPRA
jgi:antitoxin (DNA-binding transcriptional repressor) of toxin-antitoxin stability system